ncbi:unnamed protein product [Meloidogyne enterolobii]|uniref:Uncharacterized protein n=1 Tax=Meloidogyne enterolobii TaxID=390850 RepID=A0ACB1AC07_MELEN
MNRYLDFGGLTTYFNGFRNWRAFLNCAVLLKFFIAFQPLVCHQRDYFQQRLVFMQINVVVGYLLKGRNKFC